MKNFQVFFLKPISGRLEIIAWPSQPHPLPKDTSTFPSFLKRRSLSNAGAKVILLILTSKCFENFFSLRSGYIILYSNVRKKKYWDIIMIKRKKFLSPSPEKVWFKWSQRFSFRSKIDQTLVNQSFLNVFGKAAAFLLVKKENASTRTHPPSSLINYILSMSTIQERSLYISEPKSSW